MTLWLARENTLIAVFVFQACPTKWKWHCSFSSAFLVTFPAVFVVVSFSPVSRLVLPQARQLILQHGLTLSDLDRHPEVWRAFCKWIWKPIGNVEGPQYVGAQILSAWIGALWMLCLYNCKKKKNEHELELTVANSKCREWFGNICCTFLLCMLPFVINLSLHSSHTAGCGDWRSRWSGCRSHADKRWRVSTV